MDKKENIILYEDEFKRLDTKFKIIIEYEEKVNMIFAVISSYDYSKDKYYPICYDAYSSQDNKHDYHDSKVWHVYVALSKIQF